MDAREQEGRWQDSDIQVVMEAILEPEGTQAMAFTGGGMTLGHARYLLMAFRRINGQKWDFFCDQPLDSSPLNWQILRPPHNQHEGQCPCGQSWPVLSLQPKGGAPRAGGHLWLAGGTFFPRQPMCPPRGACIVEGSLLQLKGASPTDSEWVSVTVLNG